MTGPETPAADLEGTWLDGESATPRHVRLQIDAGRRALVGPGIDWPLDAIREVPDQAGRDLLVIRLATDPVQRLILPDRALAPHLPFRRRPAPAPFRKRLVAWGAAALGSVALIVFVLVPLMADRLATFIPPEGERALGEVTLEQIRRALDERSIGMVGLCEDPAGLAALRRMERRLTDAMPMPVTLSVHVIDHPLVNAFALPGGYVVFFRGLIDAAGTPEEVAAVFAHEIGHVVSRDPTRHALRSAGSIGVLGLIFGDFAGGAIVLLLAERLIEAQYSREAEAAADVFAHDLMRRADLPPEALAAMFERLLDEGAEAEGFLDHFRSHPALGDRIAAAREAGGAVGGTRPILSQVEWEALRSICRRTASE